MSHLRITVISNEKRYLKLMLFYSGVYLPNAYMNLIYILTIISYVSSWNINYFEFSDRRTTDLVSTLLSASPGGL
jgi:hypothetical protein